MMSHDDMIRRQRVLAEFGEFAVACDDLYEVLDKACRLISEALDAPLAKIVEIEHSNGSARVVAGVGWQDGVVGEATVSLSDRSSESYAIEHGAPLVTRDIAHETRFVFPHFLEKAGVVAMVNIPIFLPGKKPYGLLQVDDTRPRNFDDVDIECLKTYGAILGPVIDRLHKAHSLRDALDRNRRLMSELQHRVKNNLATLAALVRVRERQTDSQAARDELRFVADRMDTLHLVHERLYSSGEIDRIELGGYLQKLLENLLQLQRDDGKSVTSEIEVEEVDVAADLATPLGLIVNEFVTNSFKYAFNDRAGRLNLSLSRVDDGHVEVVLTDNGPGLQKAMNATPVSGTGMSLIEGLAQQLGATPDWECDAEGACLRLIIPLQ